MGLQAFLGEKRMGDLDKFKEYLELRYSPSTIRQYLWAYKSFNQDLTSQEGVDRFVIDKMRKRGNNPFYSGFLKAYIDCFNLAMVIQPSKKKIKKVIRDYKFLTKRQVDQIIVGTTPYISLMVRLFFETGLRLRDLIDAEWLNISPIDRSITGIGKNNVPFNVKYSYETSVLLEKYLDIEANRKDYPFHRKKNIVDHADSFHYYLKKECLALGFPGVHAHRFRHALGHHLRADKGFDLKQIQKKLRHSKLETTSIYTEATQKEVDDKIDKEVFE